MTRCILPILAATLLLATTAPAGAGEVVAGPIRADVVRVIDGDTFVADAHLWPGLRQRVAVRLDGVDTPELHAKAACERRMAEAARQALVQLLATGPVTLEAVRLGKFAGRVLARVHAAGVDVTARLIDDGRGRPYHGGHRTAWCG